MTEGDLRGFGHEGCSPEHYRAWVGQPYNYDLVGASCFSLLWRLGMRDIHHVLDVGCGSLRLGRLLLPYLLPGRYCGIDVHFWAIDEGLKHELGWQIMGVKQPEFHLTDDFDMSVFDRQFDFIIANSILTHTDVAQTATLVAQAAAVLADRGIFAASYVPGFEDDQQGWTYPDLVARDPTRLALLAEAHGLTCVQLDWRYGRDYPEEQCWLAMVRDIERIPARLLATEQPGPAVSIGGDMVYLPPGVIKG